MHVVGNLGDGFVGVFQFDLDAQDEGAVNPLLGRDVAGPVLLLLWPHCVQLLQHHAAGHLRHVVLRRLSAAERTVLPCVPCLRGPI